MTDQERTIVKKQLLYLYGFQTFEERKAHGTMYDNQMGFSAVDAHFGSSLAESILQGWELSDKQVNMGKGILAKYQNTQLAGGDWKEIELPSVVCDLPGKIHRPVHKLIKDRGRYVSLHSFHERDTPKKAGFRWDPKEKCWWTDNPEVARKLYEDASVEVKLELDRWQLNREESIVKSFQASSSIDLPCPEGLEYMPFQKAGIEYAMDRPGVIIGDEMGLGKTIQALGVINTDPGIKNVLVICPATLRVNWMREAQKWLLREFSYGIPETKDIIAPQTSFLIVNYEKLGKLMTQIMSRQWDLLIVDEFHYVKEPKAQRTKNILGYWGGKDKGRIPGIINNCHRKVFLSGTPGKNRPIELYPVISTLNPVDFGSWKKFVERYCDGHMEKAGRNLVWNVRGASNMAELHEKLRASIMIRRLKADVLKELPPKRRQLIELPINGMADTLKEEQDIMGKIRAQMAEQLVLIKELEGDKANEAYKQAVSQLAKIRFSAIEEMSRIRHQTAVAKVPTAISFIEDALESSDKIVVMAHHHDVVDALKNHFGDLAVVLTGEQSDRQKNEAVDRFQTDPEVKVFIGSILAAGVGITLTASSHVIFVELDWVPGNISQAEDRCHRIGQVDSVLVQHLVVDGSMDAMLARMIVDKQRILDAILDDKERLAQAEDEVSILTELLEKGGVKQ